MTTWTEIRANEIVEKHPDAAIDRYFDFAREPEILNDGDTIKLTDPVPTVVDADATDELTISNITVSGSKILCRIAGGTAATELETGSGKWQTEYLLLCTVETSGGSTLTLEGILRVRSSRQVSS